MVAKSVAFLRHALVGVPLASKQAAEERLSKHVALGVFSSNNLSSVAYATEEILLVLMVVGTAAAFWIIPISLAILVLVGILTLSYCQIIYEYPGGGGAYTVGRANLGELVGLTGAAALLIDYVLTVAVSVAAGMAALTSAFPALYAHREALAVLVIGAMVLINLRGTRQAGSIFAVPTYLAIAVLLLMVGVGCAKVWGGDVPSPQRMQSAAAVPALTGVTLFLVLRAFAAGCTALTGMEVIANGVRVFKAPETRNAVLTMVAMGCILGVLFLGISVLASHFGIYPQKEETVVSQLARSIFGGGLEYYLVQAAILFLLVLAANSSFVGFPHLASALARDGYMPHQMATMGDRLVFSNGILVLGLLAGLLIVLFEGDTHALIPLYAVGVFLSFTLAQSGMVRRWGRIRGPHWKLKRGTNAFGALVTGVATVIIAGTKFKDGAWIVIALIPVIIMFFRSVHGHYETVRAEIMLTRDHRPPQAKQNTVLLPIGGVNRSVLKALDYGRQHSPTLKAVLVDVETEETSLAKIQWAQWGCGVPLIVLPSPYRSVVGTLLEYIEEILEKNPEGWVTVVLPEILPARWWQHALHNQRALLLKAALLFKDRVVIVDVPFHPAR